MRIVVDLTRCQGYAQCAFLASESFRMIGDEALMFDPARRVQNPRLVVDPPPYRPSPVLRGPLHLMVEYDGVTPASLGQPS